MAVSTPITGLTEQEAQQRHKQGQGNDVALNQHPVAGLYLDRVMDERLGQIVSTGVCHGKLLSNLIVNCEWSMVNCRVTPSRSLATEKQKLSARWFFKHRAEHD